MPRKALIQVLRGLEKDIGILAEGELGFCTDTKKLYVGTVTGNELLVAAQTVGDMLKSVYDTNNDGIVDAASSVPWSGVTGKPSTFTPNSHTHTIANVTGLQGVLDAKETPVGAQDKADLALMNAKAYAMNMVSVGSSTDPNTTQDAYILTNHTNSPGNGVYWHIITFFYSSKTGNRAQIAITYNGAASCFMIRHLYGSTWTNWTETMIKKPLTWNDLKGV